MPTEENRPSSPLRECIAKAHERANTTLPAELKVAALESKLTTVLNWLTEWETTQDPDTKVRCVNYALNALRGR